MIFCKSRPGLSVLIHQNPDFKGDWNGILPPNHHLQKEYLQILFKNKLPHLKHYFVQLFFNKKLAGVMYFQVLALHPSHIQIEEERSFFSEQFQKLIYHLKPSILVCGNLFRIDWPGYYFSPEILTGDCGFAMNLVWDELKKSEHLIGILLKDVNSHFSPKSIKELQFKVFGQDQTMEVAIQPQWNTFADYEASLTKKYRQRAKKITLAASVLDEKSWTETEIKGNAAAIESLYFQVVEKQAVRLGTVNADYFIGLKQFYGDNFEFRVLCYRDKLVGFYTMLYYPEKQASEIHYIGFDYEANELFQIYFSILFRGLEVAIHRKDKTLELGRTARDAKSSIGAKPRTIRNYIRLRRGLVTILFNIADRWFLNKMDEKWINRNPFKEAH